VTFHNSSREGKWRNYIPVYQDFRRKQSVYKPAELIFKLPAFTGRSNKNFTNLPLLYNDFLSDNPLERTPTDVELTTTLDTQKEEAI